MDSTDFAFIWRDITGFIPHLLAAVAILILGWLGAWIIRAFVERSLRRAHADDRLGRWGLNRLFASSSGKSISFVHVTGTILYFILMLFVLIAFFDALQLSNLTQPINRLLQEIMSYLPRLLGAAVVLLIAWIVASLLRVIVLRGLEAVNLDRRLETATDTHPTHHASETIANVIFWVVVLFFLPALLRVLELEASMTPLTAMFTRALLIIPDIFAAGVILLVGWIAARMVRAIVTGFTEAMGVNELATRIGITTALGGQRVSVILGTLAYIVTLIPIVVTAIDTLHMDAISTPAIGALTTLFNSLPYLFGSLLILALAFVVGRLLRDFVAGVLRGFGFDGILTTIGFARAPEAVGGRTPSEIGGTVVMAFVMIFAAMEAAEILDFHQLAALISRFVEFLAQVVVALAIIALGFYLSNFTRRLILSGGVRNANDNANLLLGNLARTAIIVFAFALGFQQMGIGREIVVTAFALVLGAICLAFGLSFGLGSRDLAQRTVEEWARKLRVDK